MKKVTESQLLALAAAANCSDYEQAREIVKAAKITPDTVFTTPEEKKIALYARAAMYNPADKGKDGKLNEIGKRVKASKSPMPWASFKARTPNLSDQVVKIDGVTYSLEHKSGAGDWYRTHCDTLESAMREYAKRKTLLVWDTEEFTLVIPFAKLVEALSGYSKGWETFFKSKLAVSSDGTMNLVQMQTWTNSQKKKDFLIGLGEEYKSYFELVQGLIF